MAISHVGWSNPIGEKRSQGQRVEYRNTSEGLQRLAWRVLDREQDSKVTVQYFKDVTLLKVEVLSRQGWQALWPPEKDYLPGAEHAFNPMAVRMYFQSSSLGSVTRLFELPSSSEAAKLRDTQP